MPRRVWKELENETDKAKMVKVERKRRNKERRRKSLEN